MYDHNGVQIEPPPEGSPPPTWSGAHVVGLVRKDASSGRTNAWFGYYQGKPAWLTITNGTDIAVQGPAGSTHGFRLAVVADGATPLQSLAEIDGAGTAPRPNVAPPRPQYSGRLHVTYITPGAARVASTPTKWMMQTARRATHPLQTVIAAQNRSHAVAVNQLDARTTRVYFGLFTGIDTAGAAHAGAPAWLVVGRLAKGYAVTAFTDDLTQPWTSARIVQAAAPVAY